MKLTYFILCIFLMATKSFAQTVDVRTGEHDDFTRVVLTIPDDTDWKVGRNLQGYTVRLPDVDRYQLDQFFDIIPRTRIVEAVQDGGDLLLTVTCLCNVRAFLFRSNVLVVDVRDGPATRISAFELSLDPPQIKPRVSRLPQIAKEATFSVASNRAVPLFVSSPVNESFLVVDDAVEVDPTTEAMPPEGKEKVDIDRISDEVATALGVALSNGFLDSQFEPADNTDLRKEIDVSSRADALERPGILTRTGIDPAAENSLIAHPQTQTGEDCLPDTYFAIETWGDDRPFHVQLGEARQGVYGEFDRSDPNAIADLAKTFLYFGFGKEALQSLSLDNLQSQERLYLRNIAQIIDGDEVRFDDFSGQISCSSKVGMWSLLASENQPLDGQIDESAILRAYKSLPSHLRSILGPKLAQAFIGIGNSEAATQIFDRAVSEVLDPEAAILGQSSLDLMTGDADGAFAKLQNAVLKGEAVTATVMRAYLELGMDRGFNFPSGDFQLADAIRFEGKGSAGVQQLLSVQFRAYLAQDDFEAANHLLRSEITDPIARDEHEMNLLFQEAAIERMSHSAFGRLVWTADFRPVNTDIAQKIALRLNTMGFPDRARQIIEMVTPIGEDISQIPSPAGDRNDEPASNLDLTYPTQRGAEVPFNSRAFAGSENPNLADAYSLLQASAGVRASIQNQLEASQFNEDR